MPRGWQSWSFIVIGLFLNSSASFDSGSLSEVHTSQDDLSEKDLVVDKTYGLASPLLLTFSTRVVSLLVLHSLPGSRV